MRVGCGRLRSMRLLHFAAALVSGLTFQRQSPWRLWRLGSARSFPWLPMAGLVDLGVVGRVHLRSVLVFEIVLSTCQSTDGQ